MTTRKLTTIALVVLLAWLVVGGGSTVTGATATDALNANANSYRDSLAEGTISTVVESEADTTTLPPSVSTDWWATARENLRQVEYNITWQEQTYLSDLPAPSAWLRAGAYQAPNRAHNLRAYFTPTGVRVILRADTTPTLRQAQGRAWEWGLSLIRYGYAGDLQPVAFAELMAEGNRIEYRRGALTEWYVNDERGLEQGFTLSAPLGGQPQGSPLQIELTLTGDLIPTLTDDPSTGSGHSGTAIEFTTPDGAHVLRYADLRAYDATGRALPAHMSLVPPNNASRITAKRHVSRFTSHALRLTVDDSKALYPITIDPLATSPNWAAEGDQAGAHYGYAASTAGDVNGDGYDEVIVGAMRYDNGQMDEGRVFVYYGSASGLSPTADWMAESDRTSAYFGVSVDTAGDVNGDGYADVVVGAHGSDQAYVFHGSAAGLPDADGDGLAHPSDADWTTQSDQPGTWFGNESSTAGDVNGDGYDEVMVAASLYSNGQSEEGRVFLYYGSASGLSPTADWMVESDLVRARSFANGTAGDVNGDGYDDIIVGAHYNRADRAFVFHGSTAGLADADGDGLAHPSDADWTARSDQSNSRFGTTVSTAGDVNGDGYADVIIGDNFYSHGQSGEGRAFVYYGSAIGLPDADGDGVAYPSDANWIAESDQATAYFGRTVATARDVNGDGYAEVIIGAPEYDGGQTNEGAAFVFYGSATGLPDADGDGLAHLSDATWSFESDQAYAYLGAPAAGTAGDVNGDGYADVIVGAWAYDNGQPDEGGAFVYHGSPVIIDVPCDTQALINAINTANSSGEPTTLNLDPGCVYTLTAVEDNTDGPNGLPSISSEITINGHGATIERSSAGGTPDFRIFHIAAAGDLTLNDLTVSNGNAPFDGFPGRVGGGISNLGTLELTNSTVSGNRADYFGGGIFNQGAVTLTDSTISGNYAPIGGGIGNYYGMVGLINSTVSGNEAYKGGGIYSRGGTVELTNSTVSGNWAGVGGGIYNWVGMVELTNTIIAANSSGGDCSGSVNSLGHNLDSDGTCNLTQPGDITDPNPGLGPLRNNGGPTKTHALLPGSPAIDAGDDSACPARDQRGVTRPQGAACDIGAYEYEGGTAPVAADDTYVVSENATLSVAAPGVLGNDSDVDSDPLTAILVSDVGHGTLTLNADGSFTYTPDTDFTGTDTFTYQANDGSLDSNEATVTISVVDPTFNVNNTGEAGDANPGDGLCETTTPGECTLRAAIVEANALAGPNVIELVASGPYVLTTVDNHADGPNGLPSITSEMTINGHGATIERSSADEFRIFHVTAEGDVTLHDLTIRNGLITLPGQESPECTGGGIWNGGTVELTNSTVSGNHVGREGGGIYNTGTVELINSTVADNSVYNNGGGIYNRGTVRLTNSTVSDNRVWDGNGGGIQNSGTLMITGSTISGNTTAGSGGGISNGGTVELTNSTVSGNGAYSGGGIHNGGTVTLVNSTVSGNSASEGGGICNEEDTGGTVKLANTIVADQLLGSDCAGTPVISLGHNLDSDGTCNLTQPGDITDPNPGLGPLQLNAPGNTETHALLPGSPTIDAGDDSACPATDQRGVTRPQGAACDIGAYENAAPVAADDGYSVDEDNPLNVAAPGVLGNDSDAEGDPLTAVLVRSVKHGTLSLNSDGSFIYTSDPDFNGTDTFIYKAHDGSLGSNAAKVTLTVNPVNDAPVAADDAYDIDEDNTLNVAAPGVLGNDGDVDNDPLTTVLVSDVSNGALTLNADGFFTYTPDANFFGLDSFTYKANDGSLDSNEATVTLTVNPVNDPPVAVDDEASTDQDVPLTIDVLANDSDVEGDVLTVVSVTQGANGSVVINGDGTVTYTRNPGFNGTDSFTYTVSDGNGGTASAAVKVIITPDVTIGDGVILGDGVVIGPGATIKSGAVIGDGATIGSDVTIGENVTVSDGATVEEGAVLKNGASLGAGSTLGADAQLKEDASVGSDSVVGSGSQLKPGASVGDDAQIGDNVTLGENVTAGDNFVAGDGTTVKLDASLGNNVTLGSEVMVGKSVVIGDGVSVGDGTEIQESTIVGNDVILGSHVTIGKSVKIGDGVSIGDQTVVKEEAILLGNDITLGSEVVIGKSVLIGDRVSIGDRTQVKQGTSIGADTSIGSDGLIEKQVQIGQRVTIGNNVTVKASAVIPDDTVIPDGATVP